MSSEISTLKRYFESKSLHTSDYWLQCCLEWFKGEYKTYKKEFLCVTVYQQWLDSDLRDIEVRSLPINISKMNKNIINGNYAVQIMFVKDISKPAYSQLKNMRDMYKLTRSLVDNDNELAEATGKRVLYLNMTDGVQLVNGFEYETISSLSLYMTPGTKILLIGPLIIRNGEFLFKQNNIKVIGGEVEDLKVTNAAENVLARKLNMLENPNPKINYVTSDITKISNKIENCTTNSLVTNNEINRNINVSNNEQNHIDLTEFEDDLLLANFDSSNFEEQDADCKTEINDLFINSDISFSSIKTSSIKQNLTNSIDDAILADINYENLEEIERQEFEKRLNNEEDFDICLENTIELENKLEEQIQQRDKLILPVIDNPNPFIYIRYLVNNYDKLSNSRSYRVKARFANNIEKIKLSKNSGWSMKFEIKDATGKLVVDFLSEVIEKLMELSPREAIAENRSVKNKGSKSHEKITESLAKCKEKLECGDYIMDLKFNEERKTFTIIHLEQLKREHLDHIKSRVESIPVQVL